MGYSHRVDSKTQCPECECGTIRTRSLVAQAFVQKVEVYDAKGDLVMKADTPTKIIWKCLVCNTEFEGG